MCFQICFQDCRKIFTVCAHIRHIWASIWNFFLKKPPNFDRNFCMCRLAANIKKRKKPFWGYILSYFVTKYFLSRRGLNMTFSSAHVGISRFSKFPHFANLRWKSVTNLRKKRKMLLGKFYAWCPKILFCLKTLIFIKFDIKRLLQPKWNIFEDIFAYCWKCWISRTSAKSTQFSHFLVIFSPNSLNTGSFKTP